MSLFKLSNDVFSLKLNALEISVYAYLCSLLASATTTAGAVVVSVKRQSVSDVESNPPLQYPESLIGYAKKGL
mgnify:CR=1 FL=1